MELSQIRKFAVAVVYCQGFQSGRQQLCVDLHDRRCCSRSTSLTLSRVVAVIVIFSNINIWYSAAADLSTVVRVNEFSASSNATQASLHNNNNNNSTVSITTATFVLIVNVIYDSSKSMKIPHDLKKLACFDLLFNIRISRATNKQISML